jgi:hypothetical protein
MRKGSLVVDISAIVLISLLLTLGVSYVLYYLANYKVVYNYLVIILFFVLFIAWRVSRFIRLKGTNVSTVKAVYISFLKPILLFVLIFLIVSIVIVLSLLLNIY